MASGTDVDRHVEILSILSLVMGGLVVLACSVGLIAFGVGMGMAGRPGITETGIMGLVLVLFFAVAGLYIATGLGLRKPAPWARVLGFVASALSLFSFPIGTAYGIYGIYVLTRPGVEEALEGERSPPGHPS